MCHILKYSVFHMDIMHSTKPIKKKQNYQHYTTVCSDRWLKMASNE